MSEESRSHAPEKPVPAGGPEGAPASLTRFDFVHKVFATPGARFSCERHSRKPAFYVALGEVSGVIEIDALRREFNITSDSQDGKLIELAVQGIRYVPDIRPGDSIPTELIDGSASLTVSDRHRMIAQQRLQMRLLSWVSGEPIELAEPKEIAAFLEKAENRDKLKRAFREAATSLGHAPENTEPVIALLETLARELCYIEALRDRVMSVRQINKKLALIAPSYGNDRMAKLELERVQQLATRGIGQFNEILRDADALCSEILAALKAVDKQIGIIRTRRDAIYMLLLQWKDTIADFEVWPSGRTPRTDRAVAALYRFLAPRFTSAQSMFKR